MVLRRGLQFSHRKRYVQIAGCLDKRCADPANTRVGIGVLEEPCGPPHQLRFFVWCQLQTYRGSRVAEKNFQQVDRAVISGMKRYAQTLLESFGQCSVFVQKVCGAKTGLSGGLQQRKR